MIHSGIACPDWCQFCSDTGSGVEPMHESVPTLLPARGGDGVVAVGLVRCDEIDGCGAQVVYPGEVTVAVGDSDEMLSAEEAADLAARLLELVRDATC